MIIRRVALGVACAAALISWSPAEAQSRRPASAPAPATTPAPAAPDPNSPSSQARALFVTGQEAYARGDYPAAIASWEQALALDPRPQLHYNIAQAHGRLGRIEEELASLRRYLDATSSDDPNAASARARLASLEQRIAATGIAITGELQGAQVVVDGQVRGELPMAEAILVRPGSHAVDVLLDGYEPFHATVVVHAGDQAPLAVVLRRARASEATSSGPRHPMRAPIALYASGGAALAAGATFGVLALTTANGSVRGSADADRSHTFAIVSDVAIGVGAGLAVTGLVLHLLRRNDADEAPATATVVPYVGANQLGLAGTF